MPLEHLLRAIWALRWRIAAAVLILLATSSTAVLCWPRQYVASAVVAPAETTGLAASTLIQSGAVLQAGGLLDNRPGGNFAVYLASLRSPEATAMLARDTALQAWLTERREAGIGGAVRHLLGLRIVSDADDLQRWLERSLAVTQSLAAVTVSLQIAHPDRSTALEVLTRLHEFAEERVRASLADLAARRTAILTERLSRERDVFVRTPLYDLLAQHQRAALVTLADQAVAARLVSAPSVEISPSLPNRPLLLALLLIASPLACLLVAACFVLLRAGMGQPVPRPEEKAPWWPPTRPLPVHRRSPIPADQGEL